MASRRAVGGTSNAATESLAKRLRLPAIAAPMFLTSGGGQGSRGKRSNRLMRGNLNMAAISYNREGNVGVVEMNEPPLSLR
jgi:hypothetical protein